MSKKITISTSTILKTVFILAMFWLAYYLWDVVLILIASVVIASSIEPIIKWFTDRRIPRTIAVLVVYISTAIIFVGAFYFLVVPFFDEVQSLLVSLPAEGDTITGAIASQTEDQFGQSVSGIINSLPIPDLVNRIEGGISTLSKSAFATASVFLGGLLSFVLIVVLSFYLSVQAGGITNFIKTLTPSQHRKYVADLWTRSEQKIGLWLQGQLLLAVIIGVLVYLGLTIIGIKHALLLAFLAGAMELIPLFGPIISAIPAVLFAYTGGGVTMSAVVIGFYIIIQQFESQLIYPLVVKKVVGVPPIISIIALVIGAKIAGFLGILIAVPVATILMEFFHDLERDRVFQDQKS